MATKIAFFRAPTLRSDITCVHFCESSESCRDIIYQEYSGYFGQISGYSFEFDDYHCLKEHMENLFVNNMVQGTDFMYEINIQEMKDRIESALNIIINCEFEVNEHNELINDNNT